MRMSFIGSPGCGGVPSAWRFRSAATTSGRQGAWTVAARAPLRCGNRVKAASAGQRSTQVSTMSVVVSCSEEEWAPPSNENPLEDEEIGLGDLADEDDADILILAIASAKAGDERKASDIIAMRVSHLTVITSYFVFMSANSPPQLRAIINNVEGMLAKDFKLQPRRVSGTHESGWMLLDYGDLMIHVFDRESRKFYDIESRWAAGQRVNLSEYLVPSGSVPPSKASSRATKGSLADESKPDDWEAASPLDEDWL